MKKLVSLLLALCLVFALGVSGFAASFPANGFSDVARSAWYAEAVDFVNASGLMNGVGNNRFDPTGTVTRAMVITVLYRLAGQQDVNGQSNPFRDVPNDPDCWYRDAAVWAVKNGVTDGDGSANVFSPNKAITREQMATMIVRFLLNQAEPDDASAQMIQRLDAKTSSALLQNEFRDSTSISSWATTSVLICKVSGIVDGYEDGTFRPQATLSRAECAQIFLNLYTIGTEG